MQVGDSGGGNVNIEEALKPVSNASPCGPNLEYDAEFLELEEAAKAQPDQEFGTTDGSGVRRIEGSGPDWGLVNRLASSLLARSKDLRLAMHQLRAATHIEGFSGFVQGVTLIQRLLETYWDAIHPELDAEDDNDPTMRVNALTPLSAVEVVLGDLREAWLVRSRQAGALTVRDIEIASGRLPPRTENPLSEAQVSGMLSAGIAEDPELPARVRGAFDVVKSIESYVADKVGGAQSLDLKPILGTLFSVRQFVDRLAPQTAAPTEDSSTDASQGDVDRQTAVVTRPGEIRSREDVVTTLERMCEYLARTEPSNPVQLVLRRAQRMMNMNFLELLNDLAPDGLSQAEKIVGAKLENE